MALHAADRVLAAVQSRAVNLHVQDPRAIADLTLAPQVDTGLLADLVVTAGESAAQEASEVPMEFSNFGL